MKFKGLRKFSGKDLPAVLKYLSVEMSVAVRDLFAGLQLLSFADNFSSFEVTATIGSGDTVTIPNRLATPNLKRLIVRQTGDGVITDGVQPNGNVGWTKDFVYLKNNGAVDVTATVIFMR